VTIKTSKADGSIVAYEYRVNANVLVFQPQDIIASHYSNPVNPLMGQSLIEACALSIYTERQLSEYQANVLKNGGKIEGILTHKVENITEDQIKSIQAQFKKQYSEAKNSGKPLVLYGGMEYQNLGLTPTELSYLDSKKINQLDILTVFGVPKALLGIEEIGALGGNGYESALNLFLNETIKPLMDNLCQKLNEFLIPKEFELIYEDPSPVSIDNNIKMVESGIKSYYMTPNEAREIMGLDPIAGMDSILLPFNLMPLGSEPEDEEPEETPEKGVKKKKRKTPITRC
jgi:HK97 family phage portal protein